MKAIEEMTILELKGVLFNLNEQVAQAQTYANETIVPLIKKKIIEEADAEKEKKVD